MNPIFTSSNNSGLKGYWYDEFVNQFDNICKEHLENKRAKKFSFIVYDFHSATHSVLQTRGVFTDLDRLSGNTLTVFYLDGQLNDNLSNQNRLYKNLNNVLIEFTNQDVKSIPFIVFFDFVDGDVTNFKSYRIRDNEKFILSDLTTAISKELEGLVVETPEVKPSTLSTLLKETPKILYTEFIKLLLKDIWDNKQ